MGRLRDLGGAEKAFAGPAASDDLDAWEKYSGTAGFAVETERVNG